MTAISRDNNDKLCPAMVVAFELKFDFVILNGRMTISLLSII